MRSSAYLGNNPSEVKKFEAWIGAEVDFVRAHTGEANWDDYMSSVGWVGKRLAEADRPLDWTIPMFAHGGSLEAAAKGDYDWRYRKIAQTVEKISGGQDEIVVRFGEEFNGGWMPWAAKGREDAFIATFRNMVDAFRSVSDKFVFEWNVNIGESMDPARAYPGDAYVDVIGMDFYYDVRWDSRDPLTAWNHSVNRKWGLQWLEDFADARGKPTAYPEWGVSHDGAGPFIEKAFEWFRAHDVAYQSYWNSNQDFDGALDGADRRKAGAAYVEQMRKALAEDGGAEVVPAKPPAAPPADPAPEPAGGDDAAPKPSVERDDPTPATPDPLPEIRTDPLPESGAIRTWKTGGAGRDKLLGDGRNNYLDGRDGKDVAIGRRGDDTYVVERRADKVVERGGQGIDTVKSWADKYVLPRHVENLELLKNTGLVGKGNWLANRIEGGRGDDVIDGAGGDDWLTGGGGGDVFRFKKGGDRDTITDFEAGRGGQDVLRLVGTDLETFSELRDAAVQIGGDTAILLGSGDSVLLLDVALDDLHRGDFLFS